MTEKLFYKDSFISVFKAKVLSCQPYKEYFQIVLDETAFFPEGGGQESDKGVLDQVQVLGVREKEDIVYHITGQPLSVGVQVEGKIFFEERFSKMQQHSGEHIVSGLIHAAYGYNNVGFHLGKENVTLDFDGLLTKEQLGEIEKKANEAVFANLPIEVTYPSKKVLEKIPYRSKIEIEGSVRIVTIPDYDICACCAPHVNATGQIGLIKLVGMQNYKGGVRISMLCGARALEDYHKKELYTKTICSLLSAKEELLVESVERLQRELSEANAKFYATAQHWIACKAEGVDIQEHVMLIEEELDGDGARQLVNIILKRGAKICAVFFGQEGAYRYVIGSENLDVRPVAKKLSEILSGRGGGKQGMVQGAVSGTRRQIESVMKEIT